MDSKKEKQMTAEIQKFLNQVAMELEASASGAREAAARLPDRTAAWAPVQQMYARLSEANHLLDQFRSLIDEVVKARGTPTRPAG